MLRAGLTEVLVTGMLIRWISVSARPMASGAKPAGALPWVAPMMMNRNIMVSTTSATQAATRLYLPGECVAVAVGGEALGEVEAGRAAGDHVEHRGADDRADHLRDDVGQDLAWPESGRRRRGRP